MLASVGLIAFSSVPLPNVTIRNFGTTPNVEQSCLMQVNLGRTALSNATDRVAIERRLRGHGNSTAASFVLPLVIDPYPL